MDLVRRLRSSHPEKVYAGNYNYLPPAELVIYGR